MPGAEWLLREVPLTALLVVEEQEDAVQCLHTVCVQVQTDLGPRETRHVLTIQGGSGVASDTRTRVPRANLGIIKTYDFDHS